MNLSRIGELLAVLKAAASFEETTTTTVAKKCGDYNVGYAIDALVKRVKTEIESPEDIAEETRDVVSELKDALSSFKTAAASVVKMKDAFDSISASLAKMKADATKADVAPDAGENAPDTDKIF